MKYYVRWKIIVKFQDQKTSEKVPTNVHIEPKAKKPQWNIDKEIKKELEDSATENIEEFVTQDLNFDDDFSNNTPPAIEIKKENNTNTITDVSDEFFNEEFEIFPLKKESPKEVKTTKAWSEQFSENHNGPSIQTDGQLPLQTNSNGDKVFKFYWLDAWEDRFLKPGVVYLFGKTYVNPSNKQAGCVSCCVVVKNVNRQIFLLPREYVSMNIY